MTTREPGGSPIAEQIREIILDVDNTKMDGRTEALLFAAQRRQHMVERILPNLEAGKLVISDRFVHSSLAYQGVARDITLAEIWQINQFAIQNHYPDLILLIDVPAEVGLRRIYAARGNVNSIVWIKKMCAFIIRFVKPSLIWLRKIPEWLLSMVKRKSNELLRNVFK